MQTNKLLLGTLAGGVTYFIAGFLLYGLLLMKFFEANSASDIMKDPMAWWALILGNLVWGFTLTYIFARWANISTFMGGLTAGALLGFLIALSVDLSMYGTSNISNLTATLVDPIVNGVMTGLTGGVIGWVLGMGKK